MKTRNTLAFALSLVTVMGTAPAWADDPAVAKAKIGGDAPSLGGSCEAGKKLGVAELRAGRYVEAARYLTICLQAGSDDAEIKEALGEAKRHIGTMRIVLNEPEAKVLIDGEPFWYGLEPETFLTPGSHRIKATKEGFEPYEAVIDVKAGEEQVVSIWLVREGDELYRQVIGIPVQVQMSFNTKTEPPPEAPTWPTKLMIGSGVGVGISAALIVVGVAIKPDPPTAGDETWRGLMIAGGILGGMSLTGLIVGMASKPTPPQAPVIVQPMMNNQTTGVSVSGQW